MEVDIYKVNGGKELSGLLRNKFRNRQFSAGNLLTNVLGWGWLLVLPLWIVIGFYKGKAVTEQLILTVTDGNCNINAGESIGTHCFGDYYVPLRLVAEINVWTNSAGIPQPYSPAGMFPHTLTLWISQIVGDQRAALLIFLVVSLLLLLTPALMVVSNFPGAKWVPFFILGIGATPVIITLDRGTAVAWVVPMLMWLSWSYFHSRYWQFSLALVLLSGLRPQYAVLGLLLVAAKQVKIATVSILGIVAITLGGFLLWPGDLATNFNGWVRNISSYATYASPSLDYPVSYSATHSLWIISEFLERFLPFFAEVSSVMQHFLIRFPSVPGIALVLVAVLITMLVTYVPKFEQPKEYIFLLALPLPMLFPGTSWSYYSIFALVVAAALVIHPRNWRNPFRSRQPFDVQRGLFDQISGYTVVKFLTVLCVLMTLLPIPQIPFGPGFNATTLPSQFGLFTKSVGVMWLLYTATLIIIPFTNRRSAVGMGQQSV